MSAFYLDQDLALDTANHLLRPGHRSETTHALGRFGAPDGDQLLTAALNGWIFVTHNAQHFEMLHDAWIRWGRASGWTLRHSGILVIPQQFWTPPRQAQELDAFISANPSIDDELHAYGRISQRWRQYDLPP